MNDKQRIAELEKQLSQIQPKAPEFLKINGKPQTIISQDYIKGHSKVAKTLTFIKVLK